MTTRLPDWPERLDRYVVERKDTPFGWGANDCAGFAAGAYEAIIGGSPVGMPSWTSRLSAWRILVRTGGLCTAVDRVLPSIPVRTAKRGDVVAVSHQSRTWLAVCMGALSCGPGANGLVWSRTLSAVRAWRVG